MQQTGTEAPYGKFKTITVETFERCDGDFEQEGNCVSLKRTGCYTAAYGDIKTVLETFTIGNSSLVHINKLVENTNPPHVEGSKRKKRTIYYSVQENF